MKFDFNKTYYIKVPPATFGNITPANIAKIYSDGRYISPLIEALLDENFDNISYIPGNKSWDFNYNGNAPLETRGFSSLGKSPKCQLIPSNMIGANRIYNEAKYLDKLNAISGFVITYPLVSYQHLLVFGYSATDVQFNTNGLKKFLNKADVEKALGISPDKIYQYVTNSSKIAVTENVMYEFDKPWSLAK